MQRDWIDYASASGSIATALTLFYVVYKEWKTRKDITDLSIIARELKEQNHLQKKQMMNQVKPDFVSTGVGYNGSVGPFAFRAINRGLVAILTNISYNEQDVTFTNKQGDFPIRIKADAELPFEANTNGKNLSDCSFEVQLHYMDSYGNEYTAVITGSGDKRPKVSTSLKR